MNGRPVIHLDFETYSEAGFTFDFFKNKFKSANTDTGGQKKGLPLVGAYAYAEHPTTRILTASYSADGLNIERWLPGDPPGGLFEYVRKGGLIAAQNSFFEWCIWNLVGVKRYGFPPLPLENTRDTAAQCRAWSLPGGLDKASTVMNGETQKDTEGYLIMRKYSVPRNPTKTDDRMKFEVQSPKNDRERADWEKLISYCDQDVRAETQLSGMIPQLSTAETEVWKLDQKINARGIYVDLQLIESCLKIMAECRKAAAIRLTALTEGEVTAVSQATALSKWVNTQCPDFYLRSLQDIDDYLETHAGKLPAAVLEALTLRQEVGGSAPAKLVAMKYQAASDSRIRGAYTYCGAGRTKRWAGHGVQTQNMPNGGPTLIKCRVCGTIQQLKNDPEGPCICISSSGGEYIDWGIDTVNAVIPALQTGNYNTVLKQWGNPAKVVSGCLRSLLMAPPGYVYISSDYSAIEAVVLACMAGEQWVIDIFKGDGKLYERTGSKITGAPIETILQHKKDTGTHHPARGVGKVASLASGFQGARGAWLKFGAGAFLTNKEIDKNVTAWRQASPSITEYWYATEQAALRAIRNPGHDMKVQNSGVYFQMTGRALYCVLPGGEYLTYVDAAIKPDRKLSRGGWKILEVCDKLAEPDCRARHSWLCELRRLLTGEPVLFTTLKATDYRITVKIRQQITDAFFEWGEKITYMGVGLQSKWVELDTYGGKLVENITQATARFILSDAMLQIEAAGYPIVMHTHDEIVSEVPEGHGDIAHYETIMSIMPVWAQLPDGTSWPIRAAGGWRGKRYRK